MRSYYDEITRALARAGAVDDRNAALVAAERNRMIHSYRDVPFEVSRMRAHLEMLADVAGFRPSLLVVDGLESAGAEAVVAEIKSLAQDIGATAWVTIRGDGDDLTSVWPSLDRAVRLTPDGRVVAVTSLTPDGTATQLPVRLDPAPCPSSASMAAR